MQTSKLPISICDRIEGIIRKFIWGSSGDTKKIHLVDWNEVCKPLYEGGLGVKKPRFMNTAFLMKVGYSLISNDDSLWARVILNKYRCGSFTSAKINSGQQVSKTWRALVDIKENILLGVQWNAVKGDSIRFWSDAWIGDLGPLRLLSLCPIPEYEMEVKVSEMLKVDGSWDWQKFESKLPTSCLYLIAACCINSNHEARDVCYWNGTSSGNFTVKSAYQKLDEESNAPTNVECTLIWKWRGPERVKTFLWLCVRDRLLTNVERSRRHLTNVVCCGRCRDGVEDVLHVLRDCPAARGVWSAIIPNDNLHLFMQGNLIQWLYSNLWSDVNFGHAKWGLIFGIVCWLCWRRRNDFTFNGKEGCSVSVVNWAIGMADAWLKATEGGAETGRDREWSLVGWSLPVDGWVKLNTDGSVRGSEFRAAAGGLFRDGNGRWLGGFAHNIGSCSIDRAELWGVVDGLRMGWQMGFKKIEVEVDSKFVFDVLNKDEVGLNAYFSLVCEIKEMIRRDWEVACRHIYREGNRCADKLANYGATLSIGCHYFEDPPPGLCDTIREDLVGVAFPRLVVV